MKAKPSQHLQLLAEDEARPSSPFAPLLRIKLQTPIQREQLVKREGLLHKLQAREHHKLVLLAAPAGFGKSTLAASWLAQREGARSWLSLDRHDQSPISFFRYLVAALQEVIPTHVEALVQELQHANPMTFQASAFAAHLANLLYDAASPFSLVFDDFHVIEDASLQTAIARFLELLPGQGILCLTTREQPPFPLAKWRAKGQLLELTANELRFSMEEASTFFAQVAAMPLSIEQVGQLLEQTEGWVTGLQLTALAMNQHNNFQAHSPHESRLLHEYMLEEVLTGLPPEHVEFLQVTSLLDELDAASADAITQGEKSQVLLRQLYQQNMFLTALDPGHKWFRYHALFREWLATQFRERDEVQWRAAHCRAAAWFAAQGQGPKAVQHALAVEDYQSAVQYLEQHSPALLDQGEYAALVQWLTTLPTRLLEQHPSVLWLRLILYTLMGHWDEQVQAEYEQSLAAIESMEASAERRDLEGHARFMDGLFHIHAQIPPELPAALFAEALEKLAPRHTFLRTVAHMMQIYLLIEQEVPASMCIEACDALLAQEQKLFSSPFGQCIINTARLDGLTLELKLSQAHTLARQYIDTHSTHAPPFLGSHYGYIGTIYTLQNKADEAIAPLQRAIRDCNEAFDWYSTEFFHTMLAMAYGALGKHVEQEACFARAQETLHASSIKELTWSYLTRLHLHSHEDITEEGEAWLALELDAPTYRLERLAYQRLKSRLFYHHNQLSEAIALLEPSYGLLFQNQRWYDLALLGVPLALVAHKQTPFATKAIEVLTTCLSATARGDALFFYQGAINPSALAALLRYIQTRTERLFPAAEHGHISAHIAHILCSLRGGATPPQVSPPQAPTTPAWVEALTPRESEVLRWVAKGLTNRELAQELAISIATVKRHVSTILSKLDAKTRTKAVKQAREWGLLQD